MSYKEQVNEIKIPSYSRKQESFNVISHALGLPIAIALLVWAVFLLFSKKVPPIYYLGLFVFSISALLVYGVSSIYHFLDASSFNKKVFRILDHCMIFLLIAGTYTPICLYINQTNPVGLVMLCIEWGAAIIGILLNAFCLKCKWALVLSLVLYVAMDWLAVYSGGFLYMPKMCFAFILAGGITYTIGSILYAIGHKNPTLHCVFHVFVLLSTILQTIGIISLFI